MRVGTNPEKEKAVKLKYKFHRVIIPVFIPESEDMYYKQSVEVFKHCLASLVKTIDLSSTSITVLNNNSCIEVDKLVCEYYNKNLVDKYVKYNENKGKVYAILQEARGSFEDYITIADADVFFYNNWQLEIHKVFGAFVNVGVVGLTPDPSMAFYCNNSLLISEFLNVRKGKIVNDLDLELFEEGIGNKEFFVNSRRNWKKQQYFLENKDLKVVVGANHFASTYKRDIFEKLPFEKPTYVFPGGELHFLDKPIDKLGYYRVSLPKAFAYHMGNSLDENVCGFSLKNNILKNFKSPRRKCDFNIIPYKVKDYFVRIIRKLYLK